MKELVDKLVSFEREVYLDKGEFYLFALFLREDATELRWDPYGISTLDQGR